MVDSHGVTHRWSVSRRVRLLAQKRGVLIPFTDTFGMTVEDVLDSACAFGAISQRTHDQVLICFIEKELRADSETFLTLLKKFHARRMTPRQASIAQSIGTPTMAMLYQIFCSKRRIL